MSQPWYEDRPPPRPAPDNPYAPPGFGPPPPGRYRRRRRGPLLAGLLALALLTGVGGYVLGARGGPDPSAAVPTAAPSGRPPATAAPGPATARPTPRRTPVPGNDEIARKRLSGEASAWIVDDRTDLPRRQIRTEDLWIVGDTAVQAVYKKVVAHRLSDGAELWSVALPTPVCETPVHPTPDGKVVIVLQNVEAWTGTRCNRLQMIDLKTGTAGWHKRLVETGGTDDTIMVDTAITGGTLAVVQSMSAAAYRVDDGHKLYDIPMERPGTCYPGRVAGGIRLLVLDDCAITAGAKAYAGLRELDPQTGKVRWRYRTAPGRVIGQVLSEDPVVITTPTRENGAKDWRIVALGPGGKALRTIDPRPKGFTHCGDSVDTSSNAQACAQAVVGPGIVVLGGTDRVGAYDLATGKLAWGVKSEATSYGYFPLRAVPGRIGFVHELGTSSRPGRIFRIGPGGVDTMKDVLKLPVATAPYEFGMGVLGERAYAGDRLVLTPANLDGDDARREPRMLSFAPAP
ncbi:PQQ-binding-like beta-propeller repeat protein [Streptomyces sp. NPDC058855]|uniref:outer membrane protein assembly factor BamB family protein n=1 Tax=Streptomyces sp. NPDC058855 TaxID=3346651 RepID=UPI0036768173